MPFQLLSIYRELAKSGIVALVLISVLGGYLCGHPFEQPLSWLRLAHTLAGITEIRAGVYMLGDLFQAEIGTHGHTDIAVTVLTAVIGRRPAENRILVDAGGIALSKDRSTEAAPVDWGFGHARDLAGQPSLGRAIVKRANQEHGIIARRPGSDRGAIDPARYPVGTLLRVLPNHACATAAQHGAYHVLGADGDIEAVWPRFSGW